MWHFSARAMGIVAAIWAVVFVSTGAWHPPLTEGHLRHEDTENQVAAFWDAKTNQSPLKISWWNNELISGEVRRRVTGDKDKSFVDYFKDKVITEIRKGQMFQNALSLGSGAGSLEIEMIQKGICSNMTGVDLSPRRVQHANDRVPESMKERLHFEVKDLELWDPEVEIKYDLIVLKMAFHHIQRLEFFVKLFDTILHPDGFIYFDEYVGPAKFQFDKFEIALCNRYQNIMQVAKSVLIFLICIWGGHP